MIRATPSNPLNGLHHVTAITGEAGANLDFYTRILGMRLVKKTVNQDDVSAYHLFYADGAGSPGTDLTFFDWPSTPPNRPGAGSIGPVALRVASPASLGWWRARFDGSGIPHQGAQRLAFVDPEGQRLELVSDGGVEGGTPWPLSPVPAEHQIKGLHGVTLVSGRPQITAGILTEVLGFRIVETQALEGGGFEHILEVGRGGPGTEVRLSVPDTASRAEQGRGGVHHVAFRVPDDRTQLEWQQRLAEVGLEPTPVIDRFYFRSVYFREPGGILFEIATDGPGFSADEPAESMGTHLALPPFLEARRAEIEAGLSPLA